MEICFASHCDRISDGILGDDKESRTTSDLYPLALTDGIGEGSLVYSDNLTRNIEDISRFLWKSLFEKFFHTHFSYETKSLTILSMSIRKSCFFGDLTDLWFLEMPDREYRFRELEWGKAREKVGLIFIWINSFEKHIFCHCEEIFLFL
jgi:hypothetical protein